MKSLWRSLRYLKPYWLLALATLITLFISVGGMLAIPSFAQRLVDEGINGGDLNAVWRWMTFMIIGAIIYGVFAFLQGALAARTAQGVAYDLRNDVYEKIQSLSFSYHDKSQTGQLLTRATSDVDRVRMFVGSGAVQFISAIVIMVGTLMLIFSVNARLSLIMVAAMPLTFGVFWAFSRAAMPLFRTIQERLGVLNTILQENLAGVRVVKAFVRHDYEIERFAAANTDYYDVNVEVNNILSLAFPTVFGISNLITLFVYLFGGQQVIGGILTTGELVAFASYVLMAFFPVLQLGMIIAMVSQAAASGERVFEILDARSEVEEKSGAVELPQVEGRVSFEDVTFRYVSSGDPVLCGITLEAEPGQMVALLGSTGSGKSTIINLIPRFYDVTEGRILIDGYDIREVTIESLRRQIGIVLQETNLFEGSVRDNIAFGRPNASLEEVIAAARAAEADEFITAFEHGYDTRVGERGTTLSGGQKQRIAIARALMLDPRILILDDATSSVDLSTELRIQKALDRLMAGRTSFVIAQRVATVLNADQILVLDGGRIAAKGTHEELLRDSELYAEIYSSQLQRPEDNSDAEVMR